MELKTNLVPPWPLPHFSLPFGFKVERPGIQRHMACSTALYAYRHVVPRYTGNLKLRIMTFAFLMCLITRQLAGNENQRDRKRVLTHAHMRQITVPSYWRSGTLYKFHSSTRTNVFLPLPPTSDRRV